MSTRLSMSASAARSASSVERTPCWRRARYPSDRAVTSFLAKSSALSLSATGGAASSAAQTSRSVRPHHPGGTRRRQHGCQPPSSLRDVQPEEGHLALISLPATQLWPEHP